MGVARVATLFLPVGGNGFSESDRDKFLKRVKKSFEKLLKSDCSDIYVFDNLSRASQYIKTFINKDIGHQLILVESRVQIDYHHIVNWFLRRIGDTEVGAIVMSTDIVDESWCSTMLGAIDEYDIVGDSPIMFNTSKVIYMPPGGWKQFKEQHKELKIHEGTFNTGK